MTRDSVKYHSLCPPLLPQIRKYYLRSQEDSGVGKVESTHHIYCFTIYSFLWPLVYPSQTPGGSRIRIEWKIISTWAKGRMKVGLVLRPDVCVHVHVFALTDVMEFLLLLVSSSHLTVHSSFGCLVWEFYPLNSVEHVTDTI